MPARVSIRVLALLTVVCAAPVLPGEASSELRGTIVDPTGAPIPCAQVTLETPAGVVFSTSTDASGRFDVSSLPAGAYVLRATCAGLQVDPRSVQLGEESRTDIQLAARLSALTDLIVVSASQVEVPVATAPAPTTVFTERDIEGRQADSAAQLLRVTTGLQVAQSGGPGALTSVFPRGGESDYTLVLVDGVRLNSMGGGFDFASLPVGDIERVEIVRGPQSAVFGADAIGGVVQVITRTGGSPRASGLFEGGSRATARGVASVAGSAGPWGWGLGAEYGASDGYRGTAPATGEPVTNDDGRSGVVTLHVRFATPLWMAAGQARHLSTERGFPGPYGSDPNHTYSGVDRTSRGWNEHTTAALQVSRVFSPRLRLRGQASWARLDGRFRNPFDTSISQTRRLDGRAQVDGALSGALGVTAGVEVLGERARSTYITGLSPSPLPVRRRVTGAFVEGRVTAGSRWIASAGLRVDHIERDALQESDDPYSPRPPFGVDAVTSVNPRVAIGVFLRPASSAVWSWTRLRASAGTGIRPPDAFEIAFTDNPDLKPERSRSAEVGLEQAVFGGRALVDATWFVNRYDDLIVAVGRAYQDASRYRTDNIANARARGLELGASMRPRGWLQIRAGYTLLASQVLAVDGASGEVPPPFAPGDALIRRPRHSGWMEAVATHARGSAFARFGARGRVLDVDPSFGAFGGKVEAPGFAVVDLGTSQAVHRFVSVFARVTNVFDREYQEVFGFPSPGRAFTAGVRVAAGR